MKAVMADAEGLPVIFSDRPLIGLGLWSNKIITCSGEAVIVIAGITIFVLTVMKNKSINK